MGLGTMYFGTKIDKRTSFAMLDFILKKEEASLILPTSMPVGFRVQEAKVRT